MSGHEHLDHELLELLASEPNPHRRATLEDELRQCDVCRARYDELARVVADVTLAVPAVTPPLGFESRVAARLAATAASTTTIPPADRPARSRFWPALAAASVLLAGSGVTAGYLVGIDRSDGTAAPDDRAPAALARTGTGETVGTVSFAETTDGPVMVVALLDAPAGMSYRCRMHLTDGTVVDSGAWPPTERGAWVLDVPGELDDVATIEIVTADGGNVWASTAG